MARTLNKLSDVAVKAEKASGRHSDGGGLYLNVTRSGTKSWLFMWTPKGSKSRVEMGLGAYPAVSLAKARTRAAECRAMVADGLDPIAERDREAEPTFKKCAEQFIETMKVSWQNEKHRYQWEQTLGTPCELIHEKRVSLITVEDVVAVLRPIWVTKKETASRLRGRIEKVLNYAKVKGWRSGENPAAWRGNLENALPARKSADKGHHAAMPYVDVPNFMTELSAREAIAARALEFTILTASRSGEALGGKFSEVDFDAKNWTVPAARMKARIPHTVPLSARALAILEEMKAAATGPYIFPASDPAKPLSGMAMLMLLRRMKLAEVTVHGFRSSFRDWCGDSTTFPREVAEAALAHKVGNEVEQAYRRSSALEKRRKLMEAWASFCLPAQQRKYVVPMTRGKRAAA
jgi:integrase